MTRTGLILFLFGVVLFTHVECYGQKLQPVDEASKDSSFKAFRERLLEAAKKRNTRFVIGILDPEIRNSGGDDGGIGEFKTFWKIDSPDSELWETLLTVLSMGGSFKVIQGIRYFCAPYVASQWPERVDALEHAAIIGEKVEVRSEPTKRSSTVERLSYDIVKVLGRSIVSKEDQSKWVNIVTPSGKNGYVMQRDIRGPLDYRACFKKENEKWVMSWLVAGD